MKISTTLLVVEAHLSDHVQRLFWPRYQTIDHDGYCVGGTEDPRDY